MAYLRAGDQDGAMEMLRQMVWVLETAEGSLQVFCQRQMNGTLNGCGLPVEMLPIGTGFCSFGCECIGKQVRTKLFNQVTAS